MRLVFFGPPGIGKGTQAALLSERHGLEHISTGVIIRSGIKRGTSVGNKVRHFVDEGRLVPDEIVRVLAEDAIRAHDYDDFILDGYPRTIVQARWLDAFLEEHGVPLHAVISLQVPTEVIIDRLSKRRVHRQTGENFHLDFNPPPPDVDPGLIIQRTDDKPDAIRKRLDVYAAQTEPVVRYYRPQGIYHEVEGVGSFEEVYSRIEEVLERSTARS